jgi:hypothetical protein
MDDFEDIDDEEIKKIEAEQNELFDDVGTEGPGFAFRSLPVGNGYLSVHDLPPCLKGERGECYYCEFFSLENCKLRKEPLFLDEVKNLFKAYRVAQASQTKTLSENKTTLISVIMAELKSHGRPLHYTMLAKIIRDRYPGLDISRKSILFIMSRHPERFERVRKGVYRNK